MSTPSLLNIPYLYKAGTLYSQIPESGAGDFTVSRTTTVANRSTRINKDGFIETVLDNVPRLDYPVGGAVNGCPALLVEPSAQNLLLRSEEFDNASWSKTGLTASTGTTTEFTSPDGNLTAESLTLSLVSGGHTCNQFSRWPSGTTSTASIFVKADTATKFFIANGSLGVGVFFNLSNGTIEGQIGAISGTITPFGNNYYKLTATHTATNLQTFQLGIYETFVTNDYLATCQFTPASANRLFVWGAQLETGSVPTSYIPTTTAAVTRSAEQIRNTTATALIGQSEGTIYWEGAISRIDRVIFSLAQGTSVTNSIYLQTLSNGFFRADVLANNSSTCAILSLATATLGQFYKIAFAYKENDFALYINGVLQGSDNLGALPSGLSNAIFARGDSSLITDQRCRALELYPNRIPNTAAAGVLSLATLTAP